MGSRNYKRFALVGIASFAFLQSVFAQLGDESETIDGSGPPVETTGELTVMYVDDFDTGSCEKIHLLKDAKTGRTMRLRFKGHAPGRLRTGAMVRVVGADVGEEIVVAADGDSSVETLAEAPVVAGDRRTVVLLINFLDANLECSKASVTSLMFTGTRSVDGLYQEMSYGNVGFSGDVFGPFTVSYSAGGGCNYSGWAAAADAAAQAAGVNLASYAHKVYVFPKNNQCNWSGLGTVGGNPSRAWIARCDLPDVYAHELGHNMTMHHASTDLNNDGTGECEYCDTSDVMGYGGVGLRQLDAPHKEQLGWLPASKIVSVNANGTYQVAPVEYFPQDTPYAQTLKITRPNGGYYYFSYRRRIGYDAAMPSQYADRISVHHYAGSGSTPTYLIKTLSDGESFADPATGLTVTLLSHSPDYAVVQVLATCAPAAPTITFSPTNDRAKPGSTFTYSVTLRNNDGVPCAASTFNLRASAPSGWTASVAPASLTLGVGQSGTTTLTVNSPTNAADGSYSVNVTVADNFTQAHTATATAGVVVQSQGSTTRITLTASARKGKVKLRWNRLKELAGSSYRVYRDDGAGRFVAVATTRKGNFRDVPANGDSTYAYYVTAHNLAGSETAQSNIATVLLLAPSRSGG